MPVTDEQFFGLAEYLKALDAMISWTATKVVQVTVTLSQLLTALKTWTDCVVGEVGSKKLKVEV